MLRYFCKKVVIFSYLTGLLSFSVAHAGTETDTLRMVVSTGVLEEHNPFDAFYSSRLFVGENDVPFYISDAQGLYAFKDTAGTIYYSEKPLSKAAILAAMPEGKTVVGLGILGHSYVGWVQGTTKANEKIAHYLGAMNSSFEIETRKSNGQTIVSLSRTGAPSAWPKNSAQLTMIPVIKLGDENNQNIVIFGRMVGSFSHKLGLIDQLMKKDQERSRYFDLGTGGGRKAGALKAEVVQEVQKRNPLAVFAGTYEMASFLKDPALKTSLPFVFPYGAESERSIAASAKQKALQLWSLAGDENIWPLFAPLGELRKLKPALKRISDQALANRKLNIVRVFSQEAASKAAKSMHVDLVMLVASDPLMQLPSREIIELKDAASDSYEQLAPIVQLSRMDVSEVIVKGIGAHFNASVEVIRHPISDQGPHALTKAKEDEITIKPGLPSLVDVYGSERPYVQSDFDSLLGGMMIKYTDADIALFEDDGYKTPIEGAVSHEIAMARLRKSGVVSTITMNGKQLKKLIALKAKNALKRNLVFVGVDEKAKAVRGIAINDAERFKIAISEAALLEGFNIAMLGGFNEEYPIRAYFVESIYGKVQNLWFIGGPRTLTISDTTLSLEEALKSLRAQISFEALIEDQLSKLSLGAIQQYIEHPAGKPRPTISLDISYLDLGFSKNVANTTYKDYREEKRLPSSRGGVPLNAHAIIFSKINLIFDMPELITTLGNSTKYMHVDFDAAPERDKTTFNLDFRLPWERSLFLERDVVVSPVLRNLYETKIAPIPGFSDKDEAFWYEKKVLPRVNRLDSLLGVNVMAKNLGLSFDFGGMMATNFTRSNASDALDFGPGFNFDGRWALFGPLELSSTMFGYYLFPLPANTAVNKAALNIEGTVWLRLARFHDFSVTLMSDFLVATLQQSPQNVALSSIFGLTLSYGRFFRLLN